MDQSEAHNGALLLMVALAAFYTGAAQAEPRTVLVIVRGAMKSMRRGAQAEGSAASVSSAIAPKEGYVWRIGATLLLSVLLAVLLAARPADAEPRIKVSGCNVYATNRVDPIAFSQHLHYHFGNTTTTNTSTGESLVAANRTSCKASWFTSAGWFPVAQGVPLVSKNQVAVYYRAPGDQRQVRAIPTGLGIVAHEVHLNRGGTVTVTFPDCWDQGRLSPANMVKSRNGACPSTHPYRIPRIFFLIRHDGTVTSQTMVSSGVDSWAPFGSAMHADYLAANQPVFNDRLIDLCLRNAPDSVTVAHPDCGEGP